MRKKITKRSFQKHWMWETGSYLRVMTLYAHCVGKVPNYLIISLPSWSLQADRDGWGACGVCFWNDHVPYEKGNEYRSFVYPEDEAIAILNEHEARPIDEEFHLEIVKTGQGRPSQAMRKLFGQMAESEKQSGQKDGPWQAMRLEWKENEVAT